MRFITPEFHAIMDYVMAILLITSPFMIDYYSAGPETLVPVCLGLLALIVTLITDFRFSIIRVIPLKWHLIFDLAAGIFLLLSPWIFDFYRHVYMPHVVFGALQIAASLLTATTEKEEMETLNDIV